jgi:uncharacterized Zn-binding protein involved in type VI secretion
MVTPGVPPVPHVGGPILPPCAPLVLSGGQPQARIADMATCVGPPDVIAKGAALVLVQGVPASRQTDQTAHGGVITVGFPMVMIGDPSVTIIIKPDAAHPNFARDVQNALATILPTPSGTAWLSQMGANGRAITIVPFDGANGSCTPANGTNAGNGVGSDSTIAWNPNHNTTDAGLPGAQGSPGAPVILAHEMVHALHNANGNERNGPNDTFPGQAGSSARNEERSTVGTGGAPIQTPTGPQANPPDYSHDVPTENSFRDDLGIPRRPTYYPSNWPGGPPW